MATTRDRLYERCFGYCEVGGEPLRDGDWAVHHRKLRKHGGGNAITNLMAVCHLHHNLGTNSIHLKVARAYLNGWLVKSSEDPEHVLVRIHGAHYAYLGADGRYREASPRLEEMQKERETR